MVAGTPHRLAALASVGALHLERLRLLVVDVRLDAKQQCAYPLALSSVWLRLWRSDMGVCKRKG